MSYNLVYTHRAEKDIKKLDSSIKRQIGKAIGGSVRDRDPLPLGGGGFLKSCKRLCLKCRNTGRTHRDGV